MIITALPDRHFLQGGALQKQKTESRQQRRGTDNYE